MQIQLRDYQQEVVGIINSKESGSYLAVLATGLGKTVIFSQIARRGRMLILSHREELVWQPKKYFSCTYGVEQGPNHSHGEEVVSASVQTLNKRFRKFRPDEFDIIITDEAHHSMAGSYQRLYNYFKPRLHIGFTATPQRADHQMLGEIYEEIICNYTASWGIEHGWLCPLTSNLFDIGCDFSKMPEVDRHLNWVEKAMDTPSKNKLVGEIYKKHATGQTLIFAVSVRHAINLSKQIPDSVVVTADTPNREKIIHDFTDRKFRCLINCMVFTEGTDIPLIETIILCRPTSSPGLFTQMVGRGLRLYPGKTSLNLLDVTGCTKRFSINRDAHLFYPFDESYREHGEKEEEEELELSDVQSANNLLPVYNYNLIPENVLKFTTDGYSNKPTYWFLTVRQKGTHNIITKIIYTDDIDRSVLEVRRSGYTFICLVSLDKASRYVAIGDNNKMKGVIGNLEHRLETLTVPEFYQGLLAIQKEGKFNDNLLESFISDYLVIEQPVSEIDCSVSEVA